MCFVKLRTFIIILAVADACFSDQHCSKFYYEEKLLERMIKTEILVENMKEQMNDIERRVIGTIAKLKEESATWKVKMEALQETSKAHFATLHEKAKKDLEENVREFQELRDKVVIPNIAFNAKNIKNTRPHARNKIVFPDIVLNLGEAYNPETGIFTVPFGGIYLFTVQLCMYYKKYIQFGLVVDGIYMDIAQYYENSDYFCCYTLATTLALKSGNKVYVEVISQTESGQILHHHDKCYWTSFSGALIRPDIFNMDSDAKLIVKKH